jgi:hypothetical protein
MSRSARANVALARQLGIRITEDAGPRGIEDLQRIAGSVVAGETGADAPDTQRLLPLLHAPGRGGIFFADDGSELLAAAAIVHFGARASLLVAAADSLIAEAPAPALLQFEVMRRAKARHCLEYDLGTLSARLGAFGGIASARVGPVDIVFAPTAYERFTAGGRASVGVPGPGR